jgi:hypothetical protein
MSTRGRVFRFATRRKFATNQLRASPVDFERATPPGRAIEHESGLIAPTPLLSLQGLQTPVQHRFETPSHRPTARAQDRPKG